MVSKLSRSLFRAKMSHFAQYLESPKKHARDEKKRPCIITTRAKRIHKTTRNFLRLSRIKTNKSMLKNTRLIHFHFYSFMKNFALRVCPVTYRALPSLSLNKRGNEHKTRMNEKRFNINHMRVIECTYSQIERTNQSLLIITERFHHLRIQFHLRNRYLFLSRNHHHHRRKIDCGFRAIVHFDVVTDTREAHKTR